MRVALGVGSGSCANVVIACEKASISGGCGTTPGGGGVGKCGFGARSLARTVSTIPSHSSSYTLGSGSFPSGVVVVLASSSLSALFLRRRFHEAEECRESKCGIPGWFFCLLDLYFYPLPAFGLVVFFGGFVWVKGHGF